MKKKLHFISFLLLGLLTISSVHAQYDYMSIVGDATPIGWNPEGIQMEQNGNVFTYKGVLKAGGFKFHASNGDWCVGEWIKPLLNEQDLTATDYIVTNGCDGLDYKWTIVTPGSYSFVIDLDASTIQINLLNYYPSLSIVGDATPGGWDLGLATDMTVDGSNPAVFNWSGDLNAGSFKITTAKTFDNGWDWIMPLISGQDLSLSDFQVVTSGSGTDNTWAIEAANAGRYDIRVDLQSEAIAISKSTATDVSNSYLTKAKAYFNETTGQLTIDLGSQTEADVSVFSVTGNTIIKSKVIGSINFDASTLGGSGLKLVHVTNKGFAKVFKIIVR